jgi:hypothetical protein
MFMKLTTGALLCVGLLPQPANILLGRNYLPLKKTVAYFPEASVMKKKVL